MGFSEALGSQQRKWRREADVPVIVMSGYLNIRDEMEPLGFYYLQKPFSLAEMLNLVVRCIPHDPHSQ